MHYNAQKTWQSWGESDSSAIWRWFWSAPSHRGVQKGLTTWWNMFRRACNSQPYWYVTKLHNLRGETSLNFTKLTLQRARIKDSMWPIGLRGSIWPWHISNWVCAGSQKPTLAAVYEKNSKLPKIGTISPQIRHSAAPAYTFDMPNRFLGSKLTLEHIKLSMYRFLNAYTSICSWKKQ